MSSEENPKSPTLLSDESMSKEKVLVDQSSHNGFEQPSGADKGKKVFINHRHFKFRFSSPFAVLCTERQAGAKSNIAFDRVGTIALLFMVIWAVCYLSVGPKKGPDKEDNLVKSLEAADKTVQREQPNRSLSGDFCFDKVTRQFLTSCQVQMALVCRVFSTYRI